MDAAALVGTTPTPFVPSSLRGRFTVMYAGSPPVLELRLVRDGILCVVLKKVIFELVDTPEAAGQLRLTGMTGGGAEVTPFRAA